ncbi:hypothetical protein M406DRAFT_285586 [Cryphonectria parasitica EP155]|uniref:Uncharacterized protein n=1 Tax=Cryphonectria parasitica (strain ATCC 38755 / EP155) TaxID=660469 RepID=A0A9P4YC43_CRYP1|nr:uncharacterized protein M406DRAFT_285586 [Cryphonectria parasitica EP155]KAF3770814.1 hypothetical protein M406DRAFT_285586 [Cryphonectria parasitica EP155]
MDSNLWSRRTNTNKLSLSTTSGSGQGDRNVSFSKRFGGDSSSHGGKNPFNSIPTSAGGGLASPGGASFGLGTGAFSAFGSSKTPKSPGNPFDMALKTPGADKMPRDSANGGTSKPGADGGGGGDRAAADSSAGKSGNNGDPAVQHPLRSSWSFWFRPPIPKNVSIPYEDTVHGMAEVATAEQFWAVYQHLGRPSTLSPVSDYHIFKKGIRPIWEDEENRKGGKWVVRLKKGVADRYWEKLMMALIGDQFGDAGEEICGAVVSIRNGEDIISIWTATSEGKVLRIRETFKRVMEFPSNTKIEWKVHEDSIQQRITIEESRKEKANQHRKPQNQRQHPGHSSDAAQASQVS